VRRRPLALLFVVMLALVTVGGATWVDSPVEAQSVQERLGRQFLAELNAERQARGLAPLRWDGDIAGTSAGWAGQLSTSRTLTHSGQADGEILGRGARTGQITEAWMRSGTHRNLVVDPHMSAAGVGVSCDHNGSIWVVVQFRRGNPSAPALRSSSSTPRVTPANSGASCGDPVGAERSIRRLYRAYFLREADPAGLSHWLGASSAGLSLGAISGEFARSPEFRNRYGAIGDDAFVHLVYRNVLGRDPDPEGLAYWTRIVRQRGRGVVMLGFAEGAEFRALTGLP
jgi:hypothetical protein